MKQSLPLVTVVMPVFNEANFIQKSLAAVVGQDYPSDRLEILVVDGQSTDSTRAIVDRIASQQPHVRLLNNPKRIQAAAMNIGIKAAEGEIIVRVDGHTIIAPDYVRMCVHHLTRGVAENVGGRMDPKGTTAVGHAVALATTSPFGMGDSKFHYSSQEQYVDTVYLGAYWRQTLEKIRLYDEFFRVNEDYELNYRLRQAGGRILLGPAIRSTYYPRASLPVLWQQYFRYGRWKIHTLRKHPASLRWRQTIAPLFVAAFLSNFLLGFLWRPARWLFTGIISSYGLANAIASIIAASNGGWKYLPILPVVFFSIHFAWGLGFLYGLLLMLKKSGLKRER